MRDAVDAAQAEQVTGTATRTEALARLARRCARKGHAIARDLLGDAAEAEDAVQEALARACAGWARLRDAEALEGWFYRVLTNLCLRTLRRRRLALVVRRLWTSSQSLATARGAAPYGEDAPGTVDVIADVPAADDALADAAERRSVLIAVAELPLMQRTALVLRFGHERSVGEIAAMLGVGKSTVKTHLLRGLERLRQDVRRAQ